MIQRIQTLYLSLTTLLPLLFLKVTVINFTDKSSTVIKLTISGIFRDKTGSGLELIEKTLPLSVFTIIILLLSAITLFIYKNRKIQMLFTKALIFISGMFLVAIVYYSWSIAKEFDAALIFGFEMFLPAAILILAVLAYRGIKKDDLLVKSYDRLR